MKKTFSGLSIYLTFLLLLVSSRLYAVPTEIHYYSAPTSEQAKEICNNYAASLGYPNACGGGGDYDTYYWAVPGYMVTPVDATGEDIVRFDSVHVTIRPEVDDDECGVGNPIMPSSGHKIQDEVVFQGTGVLPLEISLHYSSEPARDRGTRWRWRLGNEFSLYPVLFGGNQTISGKIIVTRPNRNRIYFTRHITEGWIADSDTTIALTEDPTNFDTPWIVTDAKGRVERFHRYGGIASVEYLNRKLEFSTADDGTITVTDNFGKSVVAETNGQYLLSAKDPAGENYVFNYNEIDQLSTIYFPDNTPNTLDDNTNRQFHYEETLYPAGLSRYLLSAITDERGVRYAEWTYAPNSGNYPRFRASTSQLAGEGSYVISGYSGGAVTITNPLGKESVFRYSTIAGAKKLTSIEGIASDYCAGTQKAFIYSDEGFVAESTDNNGNETTYERDVLGRITSKISAFGTPSAHTTTTEWHPVWFKPTLITEPSQRTSYTFDTDGNVNSNTVTDISSNATRTTQYNYNQYGQVVAVNGPRIDVNDIVNITYYDCQSGYACGNKHTVTNSLGHTTTYTSYDGYGNPLSIVDANGVTTSLSYDLRQRIISSAVDGAQTFYEYDAVGNIIKTILPDGTFLQYHWDNANHMIAISDAQGNRVEWDLDAAGNPVAVRHKDAGGVLRKSQTSVFDKLSRLRQLVGSNNQVKEFSYDKNNNIVKQLDAIGNETNQFYDALNRLEKIIDAANGETLFAYDAQGNITSVTDPKGLTTEYTYNGFGDLLTLNSPDTGLSTYTVDAAGNRISETDARGVTVNYSYDAISRLTTATYPNPSENIAYTYDQNGAKGRLKSINDQSGSLQLTYDNRGNITSTTIILTDQLYTITYQYNGADRLIKTTYPSGREFTYSYDSSARIDAVVSNHNNATETLANNIERLPFGPTTAITLGNGVVRNTAFDQDYRIESIEAGSVLNRSYSHNTQDQITAITDSLLPNLTQLFNYDNLERLDLATGNYGEIEYSYDSVGNRQLRTQSTSSSTLTENYHYANNSHRLQSISGGSVYQYDAAGNTTSNASATFVYNDRRRIKSTSQSGTTTTYTYNALGQRVIKSAAIGTTHYIFDHNGQLIMEANGSGETIVEYAYLDQQPLAMWRESSPDPDADPDGDGLSNAQEAILGSNPNNSDTDGDGMSDGDEALYQLDITHDDAALDADGDGVSNYDEILAGTNPSDHLFNTKAKVLAPVMMLLLFSD